MKRLILSAALSAAVSMPAAQSVPGPHVIADTPDIPSASYQGETVEPEVTIMETEKETIYEYRVRGQLYMVKVQPQVGPPYYLLDTTGDGQLDAREERVWNNAIPQWVLFSW